MFHKQCENRQGMHSQTLRGNTIMFVISLTTMLSNIVTNTALYEPKYAFCPKLADFISCWIMGELCQHVLVCPSLSKHSAMLGE